MFTCRSTSSRPPLSLYRASPKPAPHQPHLQLPPLRPPLHPPPLLPLAPLQATPCHRRGPPQRQGPPARPARARREGSRGRVSRGVRRGHLGSLQRSGPLPSPARPCRCPPSCPRSTARKAWACSAARALPVQRPWGLRPVAPGWRLSSSAPLLATARALDRGIRRKAHYTATLQTGSGRG